MREKSSQWNENLPAQVDSYRLVPNLKECLACGKCAGNCPVAAQSPSYNPRQIIRDVLTGKEDRWISSEEIWRCLWCAGCYTGCPADIHFPLLIMQLRYRAIERGFGLNYIIPFKRFALRAREDALTFAPGARGRERIMNLRRAMGVSPWPEVSDRAREEYRALFDMTGTTQWLEKIEEIPGEELALNYLEGRITGE